MQLNVLFSSLTTTICSVCFESMKNKKAVPATILTFSEILAPTGVLIEAQDNWIVKNKICTTAIYSQVLSEAINSTVNLNLLGLLRFLVYQR